MNTSTPSIEEIHEFAPVVDALPGACVPYAMTYGEGERYELGGQHVTVIARPQDTGEQFGAAWVFGGKGVETPFVSHAAQHRLLYVAEGRVRVWLPGEAALLTSGDSVEIPPNTPYAYRLEGHRNRFLSWLSGSSGHAFAQAVGRPTRSHVFDASAEPMSPEQQADIAGRFGVTVHDLPKDRLPTVTGAALPDGASPYFLFAGEGDRYGSMDQLNTYLVRPRNTGDAFFGMHTMGPKAPYIPRHFHRLHTETFFCLGGRLKLHVNGQELRLTPGDFVHAPAGTIHSFSFDSHATQMLGLLTTDVFEKFFEYMNTPTDAHVNLERGDLVFPQEAFARVRAELDVEVVGPPPQHD